MLESVIKWTLRVLILNMLLLIVLPIIHRGNSEDSESAQLVRKASHDMQWQATKF